MEKFYFLTVKLESMTAFSIVHYGRKYITLPVVVFILVCKLLIFFYSIFKGMYFQIIPGFAFSGMATFASQAVTTAAGDGISLLMVQSVQLQQPLIVQST